MTVLQTNKMHMEELEKKTKNDFYENPNAIEHIQE